MLKKIAIALALLAGAEFAAMQCAIAAPLTIKDAAEKPHDAVKANLFDSHPTAYYAYAQRLFEEGRKDESVMWFYVGQLRFRFLLKANPGLPADGQPALMGALNQTLGQVINGWAGGNPEQWAASIRLAMEWDEKNANSVTSKEDNAKALESVRSGLEGLRSKILENAQSIRDDRRKAGLEVR